MDFSFFNEEKYCYQCGEQLIKSPEHCSVKYNPRLDKFCSKCGAKLEKPLEEPEVLDAHDSNSSPEEGLPDNYKPENE